MQLLRYNKQLIKRLSLLNRDERSINYRYYLIAKLHYRKRSGIFSLFEFMDILHQLYGYTSLHHRPGNNRSKYALRLAGQFNDSILFEQLPDGRFKAIAEKKIHPGRTIYLQVQPEDLETQQAFNDAVTGLLSIGTLKSYEQIAKAGACSRIAVIKACKRNHDKGRIRKVNNLILPDISNQGSIDKINDLRRHLIYDKKIASTMVKYKGQSVLALYAGNTYHKGNLVPEDLKTVQRNLTFQPRKCFYKVLSACQKYVLWEFNQKLFNIDSYIEKYATV